MPPETHRLICDEPYAIDMAVEFLGDCELLASDIETIPHMSDKKRPKAERGRQRPHLMTVAAYTGVLNTGEMRSFALQFVPQKSPYAPPHPLFKESLEACRIINANPVRKTLHNGVYDAAWFIRYGAPLINYAYDSMTMWWSRYPDLPKTLDFVSSILLDDHRYWKMGRKDQDFTLHTLYAMRDTESTLRNTIRMLQWLLDDENMRRNFVSAHMRCLAGLAMSMKGAAVDEAMRDAMYVELLAAADEKLATFRNLIGDDEANPNSPKQMSELFYGVLGAKPRNAKGRELKRVTKANKPSTGKVALRAMEQEHPIIKRIITAYNEAKEPAKQISNVIGIERPASGRFYTSYDGIGTTTSRFSSRADAFGFGTNAQNLRKKYRRMVKADPHCIFFELDFSAADDVFVSYESEEQKKIDLVESGKDTHSFNASEVFFTNWTYDEVVDGKHNDDPRVTHPVTGIRQITKKTTHGGNYLMAGMTLLMSAGRDAIVAAAQALGHTDAPTWNTIRLAQFCEFLDEKYRRYYPRFARSGPESFYTDLQHALIRTGGFTTIFNYTQRFSNSPNDHATIRAVAATVGQANTAGRVNMAMDEFVHGVRIHRFRDGEAPDCGVALSVDEQGFGASVRFQTHDSITFCIDLRHPNWMEGCKRIFTVMERPVLCRGRIVNVGVEADVGVWWAHKTTQVRSAEDILNWVQQDSVMEHFQRDVLAI